MRKISTIFIFTVLAFQVFADYPKNLQEIKNEEYLYLDELALLAGTDKSSAFHHYTKVYADYFGPIKNDPLIFLEMGIYKGNSVKLWESYFPHATLHFIDNNPSLIEYDSTRSHYHFIDQTNWEALHTFAKSVGGQFDIILDDAGHSMIGQIGSFQTLFPYLKSGGLYVIEDLHTSYWNTTYGGGGNMENPKSGPGTCVFYLQSLVDDLNYTSARTACADPKKVPQSIQQTLNYYQDHIDSIHIHKSVCIIKKK